MIGLGNNINARASGGGSARHPPIYVPAAEKVKIANPYFEVKFVKPERYQSGIFASFRVRGRASQRGGGHFHI